MNSIFRKPIIHKITDEDDKIKHKLNKSKISIFGANAVSAKIVVGLLFDFIAAEIVVFDEDQKELDEFFSSLIYFRFIYCSVKIKLVTDFKEAANSDVCITCFRANKTKFEDLKVENLYKNILMYEKYIPEIVKYNPKTIFLVATFPYSILTYYCVKYSKLPENRVIGIGTSVYSSVFRHMIANDLNICHSNIRGWLMGYAYIDNDHNDILSLGRLPLWSTVAIGGINLENLIDLSYEKNYIELSISFQRKVKEAKLQMSRGYTHAEQICEIVKAILNDSEVVFSVSCNAKGYPGINFTAYLSLPCIVNRSGYNLNLRLNLLQVEKNELAKAAELVLNSHKIIHEKFTDYKKSKSKVCIKDELSYSL